MYFVEGKKYCTVYHRAKSDRYKVPLAYRTAFFAIDKLIVCKINYRYCYISITQF